MHVRSYMKIHFLIISYQKISISKFDEDYFVVFSFIKLKIFVLYYLGYDAQNTSFAPVTSSDNDVPHSSIHTKPSSSSCSFQLRGINRKTYKYKNKILIETHRTANLLH